MTENIKPKMSKRAKIVLIVAAISACIAIVSFIINMVAGPSVDKRIENANSFEALEKVIESSEYKAAVISTNFIVFFSFVAFILLIIGLVLRYRDRRTSLP